MLGYPKAALGDTEYALRDARETGQAGTLMHTLAWTSMTLSLCGNYAGANALLDELAALVTEENGKIVKKVESVFMSPADFSAMK